MHIDSLTIKDKLISMIPNTPASSEENFFETDEPWSAIAFYQSVHKLDIIVPCHLDFIPE